MVNELVLNCHTQVVVWVHGVITKQNPKDPHLVGVDEGVLHPIATLKCFINDEDMSASIAIIVGSGTRADGDPFLI